MTPLAALALSGCLAVASGSDHITVRDFESVLPALDAAILDTPVAFAPAPGVQRVFRTPELLRLAQRLHTTSPTATDICFVRPVAPLSPATLLDTMRRQLPDAAIELVDYSRSPVPQGELEFPVSGLRATPAGGFWSGAVRYAGTRRFIVWAKVKVLVSATRVIASSDLKAAQPLDPASLRLEATQGFPAPGTFLTSVEEAAGRVLRRPVTAGTPLRTLWLDDKRDVGRGETVRVDVWSGAAHLELTAVAEASGSIGATIPVRNPESKRRFLARVAGQGRVSVGKEPQ